MVQDAPNKKSNGIYYIGDDSGNALATNSTMEAVSAALDAKLGVTPSGAVIEKGSSDSVQKLTPPASAIKALRDNPELWEEFDAKYGEGSSLDYL